MITNGKDLINSGEDYEYIGQCITRTIKHSSLTKRELFACEIMATLASDWHHYFLTGSQSNAKELVAERAVQLADALIKELNKETES